MAGAGDDKDRQNVPGNWKGMLKFCIENTASEDSPSRPGPMDEEVSCDVTDQRDHCTHSILSLLAKHFLFSSLFNTFS